ncbi:hydroxysqualene dehydroxylase HpnE [Acidiphilium sp. C61]|jgi:squalene-associated FAD-dependent desaturase|uniref:hydroxysqualene dehydroxylase HpnE n=1 Tax=Acidiphilium sp. C61 TaxID=1671485 RepID=UPI00157BA22B|nr:hydroxysqualene dehydroxylase HpnE [Acidiphilium sp. C61]
MSRVHVIGAGMAGLSAATALAAQGRQVVLYEAAKWAGGRCRSYDDAALGCRIDNGNHLLLSGNRNTMAYLRRIGAENTLTGPDRPLFPFIDLASGQAWTLRLNHGKLPWWVLRRDWRVPGTNPLDYLALRRLERAGQDDLVVGMLGGLGMLYDRLLEPLAIAALNTKPDIASAAPLAAVVRESLARGGAATMPRMPEVGLSESFVDPALAYLRARGAELRFGARIAGLTMANGRVSGLAGPNVDEIIGAEDAVILATPPWVAAELLPGLAVPQMHEAIVNLHFRAGIAPGPAGFYGLVGGTAEWVFEKSEVVSVTISAANDRLGQDTDELAAEVWADLRRGFGLPRTMPPYRVVKEKRATFAATPAQLARRPGTRTALANLKLAGDYTATGLPSTIEGAIRSGESAAQES